MRTTAETMGHTVARRGRRRPSTAWYCVALATVLLGVTAGVSLGARNTRNTDDREAQLPRTTLPSQVQVSATTGTGTLTSSNDGDRPSLQASRIRVGGHDLTTAQLMDLSGAIAVIWASIAIGLTIVAVVIVKRSVGRASLTP